MKSESKTPHLLYPLLAHFIRLVRAALQSVMSDE
jgi:hypothetical protein